MLIIAGWPSLVVVLNRSSLFPYSESSSEWLINFSGNLTLSTVNSIAFEENGTGMVAKAGRSYLKPGIIMENSGLLTSTEPGICHKAFNLPRGETVNRTLIIIKANNIVKNEC